MGLIPNQGPGGKEQSAKSKEQRTGPKGKAPYQYEGPGPLFHKARLLIALCSLLSALCSLRVALCSFQMQPVL